MLPRIPLAASSADFQAFVDAGRALADLHVNYETVDPYPLHESTHPLDVDEWELYRVTKMRWEDKTTRKAIVYNGYLTLSDIPTPRTSIGLAPAPALNGSSTATR